MIIGYFTAPIVFIWSVYDAYAVAKRLNTQTSEQVRKNTRACPRCAERVQTAAKVCRYCGYEFEQVRAA